MPIASLPTAFAGRRIEKHCAFFLFPTAHRQSLWPPAPSRIAVLQKLTAARCIEPGV